MFRLKKIPSEEEPQRAASPEWVVCDTFTLSGVTALPGEKQPLRGLQRAGHFARAIGNALFMLGVGVGFAYGGTLLVGDAAQTLTSDDAAVLRQIAAETAASAWMVPKSLEAAREGALFGFGFGLLMTSASLFVFGGAWFETVAAFRGDDA